MLFPEEARPLGVATPKRAREFAAGRLCARRAIAQFGVLDFPIGRRPDRRPQWPTHLTGSLTHTAGFCAAAAAERLKFRAVGIDAERIGRLHRDLWRYVALPAEIAWLDSLPASMQDNAATLLFSAKEAFYKCQYEVTEQWLDFKDVEVDLIGEQLTHGSVLVRPVAGIKLEKLAPGPGTVHFTSTRNLVLTAMVIAA